MTLAVLENTGQEFGRLSLIWNLSDVSLFLLSWLNWGYGNLIMRYLEENYRDKVPFSLYCIRVHTINTTPLLMLPGSPDEVASVGLLHCKVTLFFLFQTLHLLEGEVFHLRAGEFQIFYVNTPWGWRKWFGILLHGRLVYIPLFIYLFNHLPTSVWTRGYLYFEF